VNVFHKNTLILEENDIIHLIKDKITLENFLKKLFTVMENGFEKFAKRQIINPPRHEFYFSNGSVETMSAADNEYFGCKIVNTHKENPSQFGLPTIIANGILIDGKTGYPLMIAGSTLLTALRTGVASAIATKHLAKKEFSRLGIIGNGVQSIPHLHAISLVREPENVFIYDTDYSASLSFKKSASNLFKNMNIEILSNSKEVCDNSDVLVTATCKHKNTTPIVYNEWIKDGCHINAVGGDSPDKIELEKPLMERSKVIVDFCDQAVYEGESQQLHKSKIYADLSEIITGQKKGREHKDEITIFDSVGFAMEDLQVYKLIYELAINENIGNQLNISSIPQNSKNIYQSFFDI